jgi:glutathione synthase/RimK-type ligase-like ATP-grasp enzyme
VRAAEHKPRQLELAFELGLDVPPTLTTNDPHAVRVFWNMCRGRVVVKALSSFAIYDEAGREQVVFTSPLAREDLLHLDQLALAPMTFQGHLDKIVELRVTLIGGRVFAAAVDSQALERARVDWRKEGNRLLRAWSPYSLPPDVAERLLQLAARLGLSYGAVDIVVAPNGRHVFLEINPAGEWFWLDDVFGPRALSTAIAETLLERATR